MNLKKLFRPDHLSVSPRRLRLSATLCAGLLLAAGAGSPVTAAATLPGNFKGEAYGTFATVVVGPIAATLGKTAYLPCPCQGTNGQTQQTSVDALSAGVGGKVLTANAVTSTVYGLKTATTAKSTDTSTISGLNLLNGLITATTIKAVANASATATKISADATGSTFVDLVVAGVPIAANPAPGTRITLAGIGSVVLNQATVTGNNSKSRQITVEMLTVEVDPPTASACRWGRGSSWRTRSPAIARSVLPFVVGGAGLRRRGQCQHRQRHPEQDRQGGAGDDRLRRHRRGHQDQQHRGAQCRLDPEHRHRRMTTASGGANGTGTIARTTARIENASLSDPARGRCSGEVHGDHRGDRGRFNGSVHTRSTAGTQFAGLKVAGLILPINVRRTPGSTSLFGYVVRQRAEDPCRRQEGRHVVNGLRIVITPPILNLPVGSQIILAHAEATAQR